MTLIDVLLSSTLFVGTAAASLTVWSGAAQLLGTDQERQRRLEQLEAELLATELRLRRPEWLLAPEQACEWQASRMALALEELPPAGGIARRVAVLPAQGAAPGAGQGQEPPLLRLQLQLGDLVRERTYHPAALGGCGVTAPTEELAAAPTPPAGAASGGADGAL